MIDEQDWVRLARYFAGESSDEERIEMRRWIDSESERHDLVARLRAAWQRAGSPPELYDVQRAWSEVVRRKAARALPGRLTPRRIGLTPTSWASAPARSMRPVARWSAARAASVAVLMAGGGIALVWGGLLSSRGATEAPESEVALHEVSTRRGQRANLQLADGSRITLGVDSRLRYREAFGAGPTRDVYLDGEAYFDIARDTTRVFRVHAGDAVTRVLGTRFVVRAYAEDSAVRVIVTAGKVALRRDLAGEGTPAAGRRESSTVGSTTTSISGTEVGIEVMLSAGDLGELASTGIPRVSRGVDLPSHVSWVDGRLVFAETPLGEVVQRLSRWYDIDVRLGDRSLIDTPFSLSLRGDEAPERVLRVLAKAVDARLVRRGTAYLLLPLQSKDR